MEVAATACTDADANPSTGRYVANHVQAIAYARTKPLKNWRLLRERLPDLSRAAPGSSSSSHACPSPGVDAGPDTTNNPNNTNNNPAVQDADAMAFPVHDAEVHWLPCDDYNAVYVAMKDAHEEAARRDQYDVLPERLIPSATDSAHSVEDGADLPNGFLFPTQDLLSDIHRHGCHGFLDRLGFGDVAWAVRQCVVHTGFRASAFRDHA
jgi:hypothetical protein